MNRDTATPRAIGDRGSPQCPFCHSSETELFSLFGSQLLTEQYYCRACRTPFEYIKDATQERKTTEPDPATATREPW